MEQQSANAGVAGRLDWLDYAKAIGIALVVLGHVNSGIGRTAGLSMGDSLRLLNELIYSFHMPLFFLLAGIAAQLKAPPGVAGFLRGLFVGVAIPYLVWSAMWIGLKASMPGVTDSPIGFSRISSVLWAPVEHMWFLYHLFFTRLGWYALERTRNEPLMWAMTAAAGLATIGLAAFGDAGFSPAMTLLNFAFYGFGVVFWRNLPRLTGRTLATAVGLTGLVAWFALQQAGEFVGPAMPLASAVAGVLAAIGLAKALPSNATPLMPVVVLIGEASLAIYVMHLFVTTATRKALAVAGLLNEASLLTCATLAGILVPTAIYWLVIRMTSWTGLPLSLLAGLGPYRRRRPAARQAAGVPGALAAAAGAQPAAT